MPKQICILNPITSFLFIVLVITFLAIYEMYKTNVTPKSYIVCNYLYIIASLIAITLLGKIFECFRVTDINNTIPLLIIYFILAITGIFLMTSEIAIKNHLGLILLMIALGLVIGTIFKDSTNIGNALMSIVGITIIITLYVFTSSKQSIAEMAKWTNILGYILLAMILLEVIMMFLDKDNSKMHVIMKYSIVCLFVFFTMADTSKILKDSMEITCKTHKRINYPLKSSGLILDYINMFIRFVKNK